MTNLIHVKFYSASTPPALHWNELLMQKDTKTVGPETHLADVAKIMIGSRVHHLAVVEDGRPIGMISRHDLLRLFAESD